MNSVVMFSEIDGRITGVITGETLERISTAYAEEGSSFIEVSTKPFASEHYILNGEVTERPASPVTRTDLTLYDVPNGATLWINGESYAAEGEVELEFPLSGTYSLRVECFPYLDFTDEVTV